MRAYSAVNVFEIAAVYRNVAVHRIVVAPEAAEMNAVKNIKLKRFRRAHVQIRHLTDKAAVFKNDVS